MRLGEDFKRTCLKTNERKVILQCTAIESNRAPPSSLISLPATCQRNQYQRNAAIFYMQPRLGFFTTAALNNMRALILIFLTCCIYFDLVNGVKASVKSPGPVFSKLAESDVFSGVKDTKTAMLDLKGGKVTFMYSIHLFKIINGIFD